MHSSDRTLLAKLGFADPDKKDARHDAACQYLAQPEVAQGMTPFVTAGGARFEIFPVGARHEVHILKGSGQYATTIGFADLFLIFSYKFLEEKKVVDTSGDSAFVGGKWVKTDKVGRYKVSLGIEVKINRCPVGDILRQVALYREHVRDVDGWCVVTAFDLTATEVAVLTNEKIHHARLGQGFEEFLRHQKDEPAAASLTL